MEDLLRIPPEIWNKVFKFLDIRELCHVCLACKYLNKLASCPRLWRSARISKRMLVALGFPQLLAIPRYSQITRLDYSQYLTQPQDWINLFLNVLHVSPVEELDVSGCRYLTSVDRELCLDALVKFKKLNLSGTAATDEQQSFQLTDFMADFFEKALQLKITRVLILQNCNLSRVPTANFQRALECLEYLDLTNAVLTEEQISLLLRCESARARIAYHVEGENLRDIVKFTHTMPIRWLFPLVFQRTTTLVLKLVDFSEFSTEKWINSLKAMRTLEDLSLEGMGIDMVSVPCKTLGDALCGLSRLSLSGVELSAQQWTHVFREAANRCRLYDLRLRMVNLTDVDLSAVHICFTHLHALHLNFVCFPADVWSQLFVNCFPVAPRLSKLAVNNINLSGLPAEFLAASLLKPREVSLATTYLTADQLSSILRAVGQNSQLASLNLSGLNLSQVLPDLLANAVAAIRSVSLASTKLTQQQVVSILSRNLGSARLRELDLYGVMVASVPSKMMALSLTRLRRINLGNTLVTREQLTDLTSQVKTFTNLEHVTLTNVNVHNAEVVASLGSRLFVHVN